MQRNIEIKAKVDNFELVNEKAKNLSQSEGELIEQEDIFFSAFKGRLKLRKFNDGKGQLISYERDDVAGPKMSKYQIAEVPDALALQNALTQALGITVVVKKKRYLYLVGQTRVHLDDVENLGHFAELEVVLREDQKAEDGEKIAQELMASLGISEEQLISGAYADLLKAKSELS